MNDAERFFFVHIHKTAGTSLWRRMSRHFSAAEMFPNGDDGSPLRRTLAVEDLVERWPRRRADVRVLAGHFPLCTADVLGESFTTLTLLRHPVDRILSALREQRQKLDAFSDTAFEEIYHEHLRHLLLHNHMTKMFGLDAGAMTDGALTAVEFDRELLDRAKLGLESIDSIGFQHDVEGFCEELSRKFGWDLGEPVHDNASRSEEIPSAVVEMICEENALDIELYDHAFDRFGSTS